MPDGLSIRNARNPREETLYLCGKHSPAGQIANACATSRAENASEFTSSGRLVPEGAESAFTENSVKGRVRKMQVLGVAGFEAHERSESFGSGEFVRLCNVLLAVIETDDLASETVCQKESARALAAGNIKDMAFWREMKQYAQSFGESQPSRMKRIAKQDSGEVTLIELRTTLLHVVSIGGIGFRRHRWSIALLGRQLSGVRGRSSSPVY